MDIVLNFSETENRYEANLKWIKLNDTGILTEFQVSTGKYFLAFCAYRDQEELSLYRKTEGKYHHCVVCADELAKPDFDFRYMYYA